MPRYDDDTRNRALLLWNTHLAADQAVLEYEEANEAKIAAVDAEYEPKRATLAARHREESLTLEARQDAEIAAVDAASTAAKGMTELLANADAAEEAWMATEEEERGFPDFKRDRKLRVTDNIVRCATSGKPIFDDEDVVYRDGKWHLEAEVEKVEGRTAKTAAA